MKVMSNTNSFFNILCEKYLQIDHVTLFNVTTDDTNY